MAGRVAIIALVISVAPAIGLWAGVAAARDVDFDREVAPILAGRCLDCHSGAEAKGKLDLSGVRAAMAGGESGEAIAVGNAAKSMLWQRIEANEMPPKHPLPAAEREVLKAWIDAGAKWGTDPIDPFRFTTATRAGYDWWSLKPLVRVEPPMERAEKWARNPIDRFVLEKLTAAGLKPSPEADHRTLIRRLSFDLLGLPPTPEEVEAFVNDAEPHAYERLVERLLDSPHYGERWARHWLDIIRYAESQGFERNKFRPSAWKYRDFVVEAFNADLPYDDFLRWQIAGDVLAPDDPLAVVASGFLAMGPYDLTAYNNGTQDMRAFAREEELEGLVGTVCQAFLGLTVNCSRCHDHKFDPITQKEFYQISAAIGGTYQGEERESVLQNARPTVVERITKLTKEIEAIQSLEERADGSMRRDLTARRSRLENLAAILYGGPVHTTVPRQPGEWRVLARGDFKKPGEAVTTRGIAAIANVAADWSLAADAPEAERRKALANWIADAKNPLTPRVIVNRLWGYHFGEGIVRTASDFGFQGGLPSHPELLDWLAVELVTPTAGRAWSLKHIQRLIVLSAAYRQESKVIRESAAVDRDNRLVWHRPAQRLEAETFRDAVLAVSGELDPRLGGPSFEDFTVSSKGQNETYTVFDAVGPKFNRRSLYRTCLRAGTSPLLDSLDCPDPSVATPRRSVTTTPLQALTLLNDAFVEHYAERFAERLKRERPNDEAARVRRGYELAFARQPSEEELAFWEQFVAKHGLVQYCVVLFNASEFLYVD